MAKGGQYLKWRAVQLGDKHLPAIEDKVGAGKAISVDVRLLGSGRPDLCYWNVLEMVETSGGSIVFGWRIQALPKYVIEAHHHAVWRTDKGDLIDVSPPPVGSPNATTLTFIEDDRLKPDLSFPPCVPNIVVTLSKHPAVSKVIEVGSAQLDQRRELCAWLAGQGIPYDRQTGGMAVDEDSGVDMIELQARMAEAERLRDQMGVAIRAIEKLGPF